MKYVRKFCVLILFVLFCVAAVIGFGVVFAVRNVNLNFTYSADQNLSFTQYAELDAKLSKLKGMNILLINEKSIKNCVGEESDLELVSFERIYPCTIDIEVREKIEFFAIEVDAGLYDICDEQGRVIRESVANCNEQDGAPNIILGSKANSISNQDVSYITKLILSFDRCFGNARCLIERVEVVGTRLVLSLRSGMTITYQTWKGTVDEVVEKSYQTYCECTDLQKTYVNILVK